MRLNRRTTIRNILALTSGVLLTFAFAPYGFWPLAIVLPALLLWLWLPVAPRRAFWLGWLFGCGFFGTGVSWIFISIHDYGNASCLLAGIITAIFISILALFPAANGYLLNRFFPTTTPAKLICAFPALWLLLEWIRSWLFSGFPWLFLGYTQTCSVLAGLAPLVSIYGISLALALMSGLLLQLILYWQQTKRLPATYCLIALLGIGLSGAASNTLTWTHPVKERLSAALVQGNIQQDLKWTPAQVGPTLNIYAALSKPYWHNDIVIWPEAAIPIPMQAAAPFLQAMAHLAQQHHAEFLTGLPIQQPHTNNYYNAIIALGQNRGFYLKHRLVPFGEYTPWPLLFDRLLKKFHIPMSDLRADSSSPVPFLIKGAKMAAFICYEIAFPEQVRNQGKDANVLLTVSNDAWFGHSSAQDQHLQIAQMRALELGRPLLLVSNTGLTASILPNGKVQAIAKPFAPSVLTPIIQPMQGQTPWQRWGLDPVLAAAIILLAIARKQQRKMTTRIILASPLLPE